MIPLQCCSPTRGSNPMVAMQKQWAMINLSNPTWGFRFLLPMCSPSMETFRVANSPEQPGCRRVRQGETRFDSTRPPTGPPWPHPSAWAHQRPRCSWSRTRATAAPPYASLGCPHPIRPPRRRTTPSNNAGPQRTSRGNCHRGWDLVQRSWSILVAAKSTISTSLNRCRWCRTDNGASSALLWLRSAEHRVDSDRWCCRLCLPARGTRRVDQENSRSRQVADRWPRGARWRIRRRWLVRTWFSWTGRRGCGTILAIGGPAWCRDRWRGHDPRRPELGKWLDWRWSVRIWSMDWSNYRIGERCRSSGSATALGLWWREASRYQGTSWLYAPEARPRSTLQLAPATTRTVTTVLKSLVKDHSRHPDCPWRRTRRIVATALTASGRSTPPPPPAPPLQPRPRRSHLVASTAAARLRGRRRTPLRQDAHAQLSSSSWQQKK